MDLESAINVYTIIHYAGVLRIFFGAFFSKIQNGRRKHEKISFRERSTELSHMVTTMINSSIDR